MSIQLPLRSSTSSPSPEREVSPPSEKASPPHQKKAGRRKINIEFIDDKSRRHITFSKRKAGIMKKAYELSTLTGTQVLLLVASETGHVYTFATPKLQPLITKPEGKNLIQTCLNAPDPQPTPTPQQHSQQRISQPGNYQEPPPNFQPLEPIPEPSYEEKHKEMKPSPYPPPIPQMDMNYPNYPPNIVPNRMYQVPTMGMAPPSGGPGYPPYGSPSYQYPQYSQHPPQNSPYNLPSQYGTNNNYFFPNVSKPPGLQSLGNFSNQSNQSHSHIMPK